jgi:hypothetical protein
VEVRGLTVTRKIIDDLDIEEIEPVADTTARIKAYLGEDYVRVSAIMAKLWACYVETNRDEQVAEQLRLLLENSVEKRFQNRPEGDDNRAEGIGFMITGASGSGKTEALDRLLADHPVFPGYGIAGSGCDFVTVLCPSPSTLAQLGNATLVAMGYPPDKPLVEAVAWDRVRKIVKRRRVKFINFDDAHNVLQQRDANPKELKKIRATFRNLMLNREWPVQLVFSGISETQDLFKNDRQLKRRFKYITFDSLDIESDARWIRNAAKDFAKTAGLTYAERAGSMLIERLIHAAAYQLGLTFELLLEGIELAVKAKSKTFRIEDLIKSYANHTAQPNELNIFESPAWQTIDPTIIFETENDEDDQDRKKKEKIKKTESRRFDG